MRQTQEHSGNGFHNDHLIAAERSAYSGDNLLALHYYRLAIEDDIIENRQEVMFAVEQCCREVVAEFDSLLISSDDSKPPELIPAEQTAEYPLPPGIKLVDGIQILDTDLVRAIEAEQMPTEEIPLTTPLSPPEISEDSGEIPFELPGLWHALGDTAFGSAAS